MLSSKETCRKLCE